MKAPTIRSLALAAALALLALPAAAQGAAKPTLTVYTYSSFSGEYGPGGTIKERFEATCGCTLEWLSTDDAGAMLSRLKLEGANTRADVVLGLDATQMADAKADALFQAHGIEAPKLDLPVAWTDDTFLPFDWGWFAFVYDSEKLKTPPASLAALIDDPDGPTVVIEDPRTSTPGFGLVVWLREVYGDKAGEAWAKLKPRVVTVTQGWSEAYGLFLKGEADMVLSYQTSPAYHIAEEQKTQYKAAVFPEGHPLQVEVAGITRSTREPELARQFLRFMLDEKFQSAIPEGNWMYPAVAPAAGLPAAFTDLPKPATSLALDSAAVSANRGEWVREMLTQMRR